MADLLFTSSCKCSGSSHPLVKNLQLRVNFSNNSSLGAEQQRGEKAPQQVTPQCFYFVKLVLMSVLAGGLGRRASPRIYDYQ